MLSFADTMAIIRRYKKPGLSHGLELAAWNKIKSLLDSTSTLETELCYYIDSDNGRD